MLGRRSLQRIADALPTYELGSELGRGSWGVVYAGKHRELGRDVAIKILPRAFAAEESVRVRFVREAQLAARLHHPHIVPVFDFLTLEDGSSLIVMERCVESVSDRMRSEHWSQQAACAVVLSALIGLQHAHDNGVLHRDIKPENLLIDGRDIVKLADFGIARGESEDLQLTATGTVLGTPAYLSPEQASGEPLGPTSDLYSTGVMLFELLSGRLPFSGAKSVGALIKAHIAERPPDLSKIVPTIGRPLSVVVNRAMAKEPDERWGSASDFAISLATACSEVFGPDWLTASDYVVVADDARLVEVGRGAEVVGLAGKVTLVNDIKRSSRESALRTPSGELLVIDQPRVVVGRQPRSSSNASIRIDDPNISREHAIIYYASPEAWRIEDLGSTNGTFVNNVRVSEAGLHNHDEIRLGTYTLTFLADDVLGG